MKLAYITEFDLDNPESSAFPRNKVGHGNKCLQIYQAIARQNVGIVAAGTLDKTRERNALLPKLKRRAYRLRNRRYLPWTEPRFNRDYARQIQQQLAALPTPPDLLLTSDSNLVAYLAPQQPLAFWSDTSYAGLIDFYPGYDRLCRETRRHLHNLDARAYRNCRGLFFASDWAANLAQTTYDLPPEKIHVVPFGGNLDRVPSTAEIHHAIQQRPNSPCKLLFLGVDWQRKGGDVALAVAQHLNQRGIPTELTIAGAQPPTSFPPFVRSLGFLDRRNPAQRQTLTALLAESHFLLLPSRAECYGHVLCEANAFGVPVLATAVGGIPTVVRNGINGQLFALDAPVSDYSDAICSDRGDTYRDLAKSARREFETRLNWDVAVGQVCEQLRSWV